MPPPVCDNGHRLQWLKVVDNSADRTWYCNSCHQGIPPKDYLGHCGDRDTGCWKFICGECWRQQFGKPPAGTPAGERQWRDAAGKPTAKAAPNAAGGGARPTKRRKARARGPPRLPPLAGFDEGFEGGDAVPSLAASLIASRPHLALLLTAGAEQMAAGGLSELKVILKATLRRARAGSAIEPSEAPVSTAPAPATVAA